MARLQMPCFGEPMNWITNHPKLLKGLKLFVVRNPKKRQKMGLFGKTCHPPRQKLTQLESFAVVSAAFALVFQLTFANQTSRLVAD